MLTWSYKKVNNTKQSLMSLMLHTVQYILTKYMHSIIISSRDTNI